MTVHCPRCATGYLLPEHLMGPGGARVKCPNCGEAFAVTREGRPAPPDDAPAPPPAPEAPLPPASSPEVAPEAAAPKAPADAGGEGPGAADPEVVAAELLDELEARLGPRLVEARERGRVLAVAGPDLIATYDVYQARLGSRASAEVFRRLVRERLGVSLEKSGR